MGFPCKEKSHIFTLFANFCHQSIHQVRHSTLTKIVLRRVILVRSVLQKTVSNYTYMCRMFVQWRPRWCILFYKQYTYQLMISWHSRWRCRYLQDTLCRLYRLHSNHYYMIQTLQIQSMSSKKRHTNFLFLSCHWSQIFFWYHTDYHDYANGTCCLEKI